MEVYDVVRRIFVWLENKEDQEKLELNNYLPISLLNGVYKINSNMLAKY